MATLAGRLRRGERRERRKKGEGRDGNEVPPFPLSTMQEVKREDMGERRKERMRKNGTGIKRNEGIGERGEGKARGREKGRVEGLKTKRIQTGIKNS